MAAHLVGALVGDLDAHVLEQRKHVRQGQRRARAVELRAQDALGRLERPVQAHRDLPRLERLDALDVDERRARDPVRAIGRREGVAVDAPQRVAALLAFVLDQRLLEIVDPGARRGEDAALDRVGVDLEQPRLAVDHVMQAHQHRLRHARRVVDARRVERFAEDRLDATAVVGVEAVARDEDQARQEAPELVGPDEQPQALALAQVQDPHRGLEQLVDRDLEQLVARVGLEDLDQRLLVVAVVREGGALEHCVVLAAQDRDLGRARVVRGVRVEAEEAALADDVAVGVEQLDADVVEVGRAVNRRARVRLRQVQQVRLERQRAHRRRQLAEAVRARTAATQDAQAGAFDRDQAHVTLRLVDAVLAIAEEREVVRLEPFEERARLRYFPGVDACRWVLLQGRGDVGGLRPHRFPVRDGSA